MVTNKDVVLCAILGLAMAHGATEEDGVLSILLIRAHDLGQAGILASLGLEWCGSTKRLSIIS
jgi:hypothetical protein